VAHEFRLPDIGEGLVDAEIVRWHVAVGDVVSADDVLVEIETAKAVVEIPSPHAGTVLRLGGGEGATIEVGEVLVVIGEEGESAEEPAIGAAPSPATSSAAAAPVAPVPSSDGAVAAGGRPRAMPVVRKLAAEHGIDLDAVVGTGPGGAISRADVEALISAPQAAADDEDRVPLSRMRRSIRDHMSKSWREIPHVTVFADIDATGLLAARRDTIHRLGRTVPIEAIVIRAVLPALGEFPEFNATLDGDDLVLKRHYDIAVAVDTPDGLIVPALLAADQLGLEDLVERIADLTERAQQRRVTPEEAEGGTFTVSNIGALGGGHGTPIIPYGTTSIISVGRAVPAVVVRDGAMVMTTLMPVSLSYDHRVIDGGLGQRFLSRVVDNLEDPSRLLS
jgi:pyruvate dehydrogenase E2 component (dihydrolipoamide acetyltransferase)